MRCNCGWVSPFKVDDRERAELVIPIHQELVLGWEKYYGGKWPRPAIKKMVLYEDNQGTILLRLNKQLERENAVR